MNGEAVLAERERLYSNLSLLEALVEYATRPRGESDPPQGVPGLTDRASSYLASWPGHAAIGVWLAVAQPTVDALSRFRAIDAHIGVERANNREYFEELKRASSASKIALDSLIERIEFLAQQADSRAS